MAQFTLKPLRKKARLTQAALATQIGAHVQTVSRWERREMVPRADVLEKLATALGCEVKDFFANAA